MPREGKEVRKQERAYRMAKQKYHKEGNKLRNLKEKQLNLGRSACPAFLIKRSIPPKEMKPEKVIENG